VTEAHSDGGDARPRPGLKRTLLICLPLVIAGAAALWLIFNTEPEAKRESAVRETAMLVEVIDVEAGDFRPQIRAQGTVKPARAVVLRPRVGSEVVELAPEFVPGGEVATGDLLLRIDDADYRIMLERRESELQESTATLWCGFALAAAVIYALLAIAFGS
jgi:multidrug efflux pump subunit AcrA (membrane-fusion protein)